MPNNFWVVLATSKILVLFASAVQETAFGRSGTIFRGYNCHVFLIFIVLQQNANIPYYTGTFGLYH